MPIIASDCHSGPREILSDGNYGLLVPPNDTAALAQGIVDFFDGKVTIKASPEARLARAKEFDSSISAKNTYMFLIC